MGNWIFSCVCVSTISVDFGFFFLKVLCSQYHHHISHPVVWKHMKEIIMGELDDAYLIYPFWITYANAFPTLHIRLNALTQCTHIQIHSRLFETQFVSCAPFAVVYFRLPHLRSQIKKTHHRVCTQAIP